MITFHSVSWDEYFSDPERAALWAEHYDEFWPVHQGRISMAPDESFYRAAAAAGMLEIVIARKEGRMIAYALALVKRHPHYGALCAFEDSYYLTKSERLGGIGKALILEMNKVCQRRGAFRIFWFTKMFKNMDLLFQRLGAEHTDNVWAFWLKEEGAL